MLLDQILFLVPCPIFWKNTSGELLGCNKAFLAVAGFDDYTTLIGKTDAELPWNEYKDEYYNWTLALFSLNEIDFNLMIIGRIN